MKKAKNLKKQKIFIVFSVVTVLLCLTLLIVYFAINRRDYNLYDLKVNDVSAQKTEDEFFVKISQSKEVSVTYRLRDEKSRVYCYSDAALTQENTNLTGVYIGGLDARLYFAVKEGGKIKKTATLKIENTIAKDEEFAFFIDGILPQKNENGYKILLPHGTDRIDMSNITVGTNFSYVLYFDEARKNPVEDLTSIPLKNGQTLLYIDIKNVNVADVVKSFCVAIEVEKSSANSILGLTANGVAAQTGEEEITVQIIKCKTLDLRLKISENATFKMYTDEQKTVEVPDGTSIDVTDYLKSATFYAKVTAQNGKEKPYKIQIDFLLENNAEIEYMGINGVKGQKSGNEIVFLLNRTTSLELEAKTVSANAACEFFYDRTLADKIIDEKNIDIHAVQTSTIQLFCVVIAQDNTTNVYIATVTFIPSADCELLNLTVNNVAPEFKNGLALLVFEGVVETFLCDFEQIKASRGATVAVFLDRLCTIALNGYKDIQLASAVQTFFIKVTAENTSDFAVYEVEITLISNDNALKSITINGQEYLINADTVNISIDADDRIDVNAVKHDGKATVSLFYDILQTEPVPDKSNVAYRNNHTQLYLRVLAENLSVKVYKLNIDIKFAPEIVFNNSSLQLREWQTKLQLSDLFTVKNNSYPSGRFDVEVLCDGVKQNTDFLTVQNESRFLDVQVNLTSPYFKAYNATKSVQILPYTLRPVGANLSLRFLETKDEAVSLLLKELVQITDGSYTIGKDYYVEIYAANNDVQVAVNKDAVITLKSGIYKIYINSFRNLFSSIKVGEIAIKVLQKRKPVIASPDFLELNVSNQQVKLADLFELEKNDAEILLTKTLVNGTEQEYLTQEAGMYKITLQVFYNGGMLEKSLLIEIAALSNNTCADVFVNESKLEFADGPVILADLNYSDRLYLKVCNFNSKATVKASVNGVQALLGELNLAAGMNEIRIVITAQSGRVQEYVVNVFKKERRLPTIETTDKTVKLEKNQIYVMFGGYYSVMPNDYVASVKLYCLGNELFCDCLTVENTERVYNVEIRLSGEFGTISKFLNIGVLAYKSVEITFNTTTVSAKADYVFTQKDFLNDVTFYGTDSARCSTVMLIGGEKFVSRALNAGLLIITVQIWQDGLLLKEESAWFTLRHTQEANPISVDQTIREVQIHDKTLNADFDAFFTIRYGSYAPKNVKITYIYMGTQVMQSRLILFPGKNEIIVILTDSTTDAEIFSGKFVIKCNYAAKSERVFARMSINNRQVKIKGNDLILLNTAPLQSVNLLYTAQSGLSVNGLLSSYALQPGLNAISYFVQEGSYAYTGTLNVYNLCPFDHYLTGISYNGIAVENKILLLKEDTVFKLNMLTVVYNEFSHISIQKEMSKFSDTIFDVTVTASYDGFAIGSVIFRVFIGKQMPRLIQIVGGVLGDGVVYYGINEFGLDVYAVTGANSVAVELIFSEAKYSAVIKFENLTIGENIRSFSVWENNTIEYVYSAKLTILPQSVLKSVSYNGTALQELNNLYILNSEDIDLQKISYGFADSTEGLNFTVTNQPVYHNGNIVGYNFQVLYKFVCVQSFSVVSPNENTSVNVSSGGTALTQSGSTLFKATVEIEKSLTADPMLLRYLIKPVYPFASVEGNGIKNEEVGYILTIDLSEISLYEAGTYTMNCLFTVNGVSATTEYTLNLVVTVTDSVKAK